jgi:hypothetical protein
MPGLPVHAGAVVAGVPVSLATPVSALLDRPLSMLGAPLSKPDDVGGGLLLTGGPLMPESTTGATGGVGGTPLSGAVAGEEIMLGSVLSPQAGACNKSPRAKLLSPSFEDGRTVNSKVSAAESTGELPATATVIIG